LVCACDCAIGAPQGSASRRAQRSIGKKHALGLAVLTQIKDGIGTTEFAGLSIVRRRRA
jgi:hypothetical protein